MLIFGTGERGRLDRRFTRPGIPSTSAMDKPPSQGFAADPVPFQLDQPRTRPVLQSAAVNGRSRFDGKSRNGTPVHQEGPAGSVISRQWSFRGPPNRLMRLF